MTSHTESRIVPYPADLMYAIVVDVERYPQFVPWCVGLRVLKRESVGPRQIMLCETLVGFRGLREKYTSRVTAVARDTRVDVEQVSGVFRKLDTHWRFTPQDEKSCRVDFSIDFEFKSRVLGAVAGTAFAFVATQMTRAFEERARKLSEKPL
ncbi:MAG TPA: type II toxin-antitoxin system RatA family toxin [Rhizomicrobium sp.]|nr:type II toxin-antitoxin system RatA family toxin [Rhizomicrobium sp.]